MPTRLPMKITIPALKLEEDITSYNFKWKNTLPNGISSEDGGHLGMMIDEKHGVIVIGWEDKNARVRFGIFKIEDFTPLFVSPSDEDYQYFSPWSNVAHFIIYASAYLYTGGISRSILTYALLLRIDNVTIEVWRGGSAPLWTRNVTVDAPGERYVTTGLISPSGKYIAVVTAPTGYMVLYEGVTS